jgi:hypothetical protein
MTQPHQQGDPVTTTVDTRSDLYAFAMQGKENSPAISERASEEIDAFRAAVVRDVLWRLEQSSGDQVAAKLVEDNPELAELLNATEERHG